MIHKRYRLNGTPDPRRWIFECDHCNRRRGLRYINGWLILDHPDPRTRIYCGVCVDRIAAALLTWAMPSA
ncbi:hypothetical protein [Sphaerisporangium perillae]|uniref:hypothetical protein n=1 Tax=Sphaerisporangium perillae TaxID=2935860 RepID=UPI00200E6B33|nr:hypothetical protein [Sphaerisporangium perillae]